MKIVLVEDSEVIRKQLVRLLAEVSGVSVIGQADNEDAALELIRGTSPDVVLVDIGLAEGSGMRVLERARQIGFAGKLFVLSNRDPDFYEMLCARHGADAFYDKAHSLDRLVADLQTAADAKHAS
ncbi:Response regulator receiver domain-containing protein [Roseateles sp. YR242]|uniref:response regulator transcription factor n=1 Tax=Roseateles sp. YR242 TaxID=1855305 RepID=UPI0008D1EEBE|nr:response regulator [Roseateles sp. YR242]SEL37363.1 Response regulator receiver domain-containing protein [Roseateles sp. YR242]